MKNLDKSEWIQLVVLLGTVALAYRLFDQWDAIKEALVKLLQ